MSWQKTVLICGAILLVAAVALTFIFLTEPTATRGGATKETAMLVEIVEVERGTYRPTIEAMGAVEPAREVVLSPRVSGEVIERAAAFTPGSTVRRGEVLLRIDPADYENTVAQRHTDVSQARADLQLEMGQQDIARQDYELIDDTLPEGMVTAEKEALVLRQPQLETARARLAAAEAALEQAEIELARTTLVAPFDAHVLERQVDVGSQVAPGDQLGRLVGVDTYWVVAAVPLAKLRFLSIPTGTAGEPGSPVEIRHHQAWPEGTYRAGRVDSVIGELAEATRMARVVITVDDPLARRSDAPALMLDAFVEAHIEGEPIEDVVRLERDYLRQDDSVWVMAEDGTLDIRRTEVVFRNARWAYIAEGLADGERVVTSNLATVVDGARLRLEGESSAPSSPDAAAGAAR